jgi:hypothetical protein
MLGGNPEINMLLVQNSNDNDDDNDNNNNNFF